MLSSYRFPPPSMPSSPTPKSNFQSTPAVKNRLYSVTHQNKGVYYKLLDHMHKRKNLERMQMAMDDVPNKELKEPRVWTLEDDQKLDFHNLANGPAYMTVGKKNILVAKYFSPKENHALGLFPEMVIVRDHFLNPVNQKKMRAVQTSSHLKNRGDCFDGALSVPPIGKNIGLGRLAKYMPSNAEMIKLISKMSAQLILKAHPEVANEKEIFLRHWAKHASITVGHEDNTGTSSFQVNCHGLDAFQKEAEPALDLKTKIGSKGEFHTDGNDEPVRYTVVFFISGPPDATKWYEGKFVIAPQRLYCEGAAFGALVFSAKYAHKAMGYGWYASDLPENQKYHSDIEIPAIPSHLPPGRVTIPVYPRNGLMRPKREALAFLNDNNTFNGNVLAGLFGTMRNQQEWLMRFAIMERMSIDARTPQQWCNSYPWTENGQQEVPRLWIAKMCLANDPTLEADYKELTEMIKAVGCGSTMPEVAAETRRKKAEKLALRGGKWKKNPDEAKTKCQWISHTHTDRTGKKCNKGVFISEWGGLCMAHFKERKDRAREERKKPVNDDQWEDINESDD